MHDSQVLTEASAVGKVIVGRQWAPDLEPEEAARVAGGGAWAGGGGRCGGGVTGGECAVQASAASMPVQWAKPAGEAAIVAGGGESSS